MNGDKYLPIAEHGIVGDLHSIALVGTDGTIDWYCCPRFDSPSVFGSLLDHDRGGHFRVRPRTSRYTTKQLYFPDTAILITRFMTEKGVGRHRADAEPPAGSAAALRARPADLRR